MQIAVTWASEDLVRFTLEGELDVTTLDGVRVLEPVIAGCPSKVEVLLGELRLIDSCGVGCLVQLFKRVRAQGGRMSIRGLRGQPLAIFQLLRLDEVMSSDDSGHEQRLRND